MTTHDDTRSIAQRFFNAWNAKDERATRALLADDVEFQGPMNELRGGDELLTPLMRFSATVRGTQISEFIVEGDRAMILYYCDLPQPIGSLRTVWFLQVVGGKVQTLRSVFDATEVRKGLAAKKG